MGLEYRDVQLRQAAEQLARERVFLRRRGIGVWGVVRDGA